MDMEHDQRYNDPDKPTCKVAKVYKNGTILNRAMIYPTPCEVRYEVYLDAEGDEIDSKTFTKRGMPKKKIKTIDEAYYMRVGPFDPSPLIIPTDLT